MKDSVVMFIVGGIMMLLLGAIAVAAAHEAWADGHCAGFCLAHGKQGHRTFEDCYCTAYAGSPAPTPLPPGP